MIKLSLSDPIKMAERLLTEGPKKLGNVGDASGGGNKLLGALGGIKIDFGTIVKKALGLDGGLMEMFGPKKVMSKLSDLAGVSKLERQIAGKVLGGLQTGPGQKMLDKMHAPESVRGGLEQANNFRTGKATLHDLATDPLKKKSGSTDGVDGPNKKTSKSNGLDDIDPNTGKSKVSSTGYDSNSKSSGPDSSSSKSSSGGSDDSSSSSKSKGKKKGLGGLF